MVKRIIFAGNNQIAVDILEFLKKQKAVEIVALVVHPPKLAKKRNALIKISGLHLHRVFSGNNLNSPSTVEALRRLKPDLFLSINFRYILKPDVILLPKYGCINLHFGYLPWNRGVFADAWSIIEDSPAGVTYHLIDSGIDTGAIISQRKVKTEMTWRLRSGHRRSWPPLHRRSVRFSTNTGQGIRGRARKAVKR